MSTETQQADYGEPTETEILKSQLFSLRQMYGEACAAQSSQAAEIEALRNELKTASAHLHRARRNARNDGEEMAYTQALKGIDALLDATMQTKEAS